MPLDESIIDEALQDASISGTEKQFLALLRRVRTDCGHQNVKIGHFYWIWEQIEKGIPANEIMDIPGFIKDD